MTGDGTIAGQYGGTPGQKQQYFGKIDPFCLFAVVPMVIVAALSFWGDVAILGVVLIILAILVVVFDSWANRPAKKNPQRPPQRQRYRDGR